MHVYASYVDIRNVMNLNNCNFVFFMNIHSLYSRIILLQIFYQPLDYTPMPLVLAVNIQKRQLGNRRTFVLAVNNSKALNL